MKAILMMALVVLLATTSFAQSNTETEMKAISAKRVQWLLEGKAYSLLTIYDENSMTVHSNGLIKSSAEHINDVRNGIPTYKSIEIGETTVKDFGNTAILVGKGRFSITMAGSEMTLNMVYTEVYQKKGTHWKLIARHAGSVQ